jgi:beta-lactamase regulating signal transducer with metallopeptidase domain
MPMENSSKILNLNKVNTLQEDENNNKQVSDKNNNKQITVSNNVNNLEKSTIISKLLKGEMLFYIWILGAIIFISKEAYISTSFYKKLNGISNIIEEESILEVLETSKKKLNIKRKILLKECEDIKSPMITGIIVPVITIPKINHDLDKLEIILYHELIHFKRKDLWIKMVALFANMINWFNPIIYIIRNKINIICELSLDEQLIKNMDKSKRKYYGEIILELIEYSQNESLALGASVCKSRKELETRLKNIVFFKKSKKIIVGISLLVTMFFTSTSVFAANTVLGQNSNPLIKIKTTEFAVFVANDGLYMSELKDNNPILLDKSEKIKLPKISKDGLYVAYTKEDSLYICNIKTHEIYEVAQNIESYDWNNLGNLIYSDKNPGISMYNTNTKSSVNLINNEYNYFNINCDSKNKIYANKSLISSNGETQTIKPIGIISYDLDSKKENIILESKQGTNKEIGEKYTISELFESLGSTPTVAKISTDDRYMYIYNMAKSGSVSADATEFAVYDLINNKFIENNNMITLAYKDNISQDPIDSRFIAVNNGEGREMYSNKNLGIYNLENNTFTNLIPDDQVSMMPDYSEDGRDIIYSGTEKLKDNELGKISDWFNQPHHIYSVNVDTKKVTQITNNNSCDFMPKYLLNDEILFVRQAGDSYSLWKTKDGIETKLADSVDFDSKDYTNSWYYGHYDTENVIDVFLG